VSAAKFLAITIVIMFLATLLQLPRVSAETVSTDSGESEENHITVVFESMSELFDWVKRKFVEALNSGKDWAWETIENYVFKPFSSTLNTLVDIVKNKVFSIVNSFWDTILQSINYMSTLIVSFMKAIENYAGPFTPVVYTLIIMGIIFAIAYIIREVIPII